jgi:hypothetical protein
MLEVTRREFSKPEAVEQKEGDTMLEAIHVSETREVAFDIDVIETIKKIKELAANIAKIENSF